MSKIFYFLVHFVGLFIRQFLMPNPFTPFGESAVLINWIVGGAFIPLSYFMTSFIYERGSAPALGSFLFLLIYAVNTGITCLVCLAYPMIWLMVLIAVVYLIVYLLIALKIKGSL